MWLFINVFCYAHRDRPLSNVTEWPGFDSLLSKMALETCPVGTGIFQIGVKWKAMAPVSTIPPSVEVSNA
jgi:hypothetical protein